MKIKKLTTLSRMKKEIKKIIATTWVDYEAIKTKVTKQAVFEGNKLAKDIRRQGSELHGRCPIHKGKGEESFRASVKKNCFHCFSCGAKGNVMDFVAFMERCTVREAAIKIQDWFSLAPASTGQVKTAPAETE